MTTVEPIRTKEDIEKVENLLAKQSKRDYLQNENSTVLIQISII